MATKNLYYDDDDDEVALKRTFFLAHFERALTDKIKSSQKFASTFTKL